MSNYIERYWRDAKPEDAIKEPPMVARFRDKSTLQWSDVQKLRGWVRQTCYGWVGEGGMWTHCQVYDAPDPGEGWRLIDTEREKAKLGDEFLTQSGVWWLECRHNGFEDGVPYRRRITPTVTYVPFTWEDREQLRGRWIKFKHPGSAEFLISKLYNSDKHGLMANEYSASSLLDEAIFLDTGKPVGKEVMQ